MTVNVATQKLTVNVATQKLAQTEKPTQTIKVTTEKPALTHVAILKLSSS